MAWLCRDGEVLAALEIADTRLARRRGLLGRASIDGALLLKPAFSVHTLGMAFAIDVAYLDVNWKVLSVRRMPPRRVGRPRLRARSVLEAEAGSFERWGVQVGDVLEPMEPV